MRISRPSFIVGRRIFFWLVHIWGPLSLPESQVRAAQETGSRIFRNFQTSFLGVVPAAICSKTALQIFFKFGSPTQIELGYDAGGTVSLGFSSLGILCPSERKNPIFAISGNRFS